MANELRISELNPIALYDTDRVNINKYQTKYMEKWMHGERIKPWQQRRTYKQIWQTTDIISFQFTSDFDPIIVKLINERGVAVITSPALIGLPNIYFPGSFSFSVEISLAGLPTGCYWVNVEAGTGINKTILESDKQYVSSTPIKDSVCIEYWNSVYHKDIVFETGIKFQIRIVAVQGFLSKYHKDDRYRSGSFNNSILASKTIKQWDWFLGGRRGIPDEIINLVDEIFTCDSIWIDDKNWNLSEEGKFEFYETEDYPMRGVKVILEEGINRHSRIFGVDIDPTKRLITTVMVSAKVFGDTHNQASNNVVPTINIE